MLFRECFSVSSNGSHGSQALTSQPTQKRGDVAFERQHVLRRQSICIQYVFYCAAVYDDNRVQKN